MEVKKEGVVTIYNEKGDLTGIVLKDMSIRKNIIYSCKEKTEDEIFTLLGGEYTPQKED